MICVYTGAVVHLTNFNATVRADVFADEHSVLIQWGAPGPKCEEQALQYGADARVGITHKATIGPHGCYHHKTRGITVVPRANFEGEFR